MPYKKAIFFAYLIEAEEVIKNFGFEIVQDAPFKVYGNSNGVILALSGIGQLNAANCFWHTLSKFPFLEALNVGAAGSLKEDFSLGEILEIESVRSLDIYFKKVFSLETEGKFNRASLLTAYEPVKDFDLRKKYASLADVVDMEAAGFCAAAKINNTPIKVLKFMSDFSAECDIPQNIIKVRKVLNAHSDIFK